MEKFFMSCVSCKYVNLAFVLLSLFVIFGHGELYAYNSEDKSTQDIHETKKLAEISLELEKTKKDLDDTNETLKNLMGGMSEQFISNFRDTIALIGIGIGIITALLGGVFVWGYSKLHSSISTKVRKESEKAQ